MSQKRDTRPVQQTDGLSAAIALMQSINKQTPASEQRRILEQVMLACETSLSQADTAAWHRRSRTRVLAAQAQVGLAVLQTQAAGRRSLLQASVDACSAAVHDALASPSSGLVCEIVPATMTVLAQAHRLAGKAQRDKIAPLLLEQAGTLDTALAVLRRSRDRAVDGLYAGQFLAAGADVFSDPDERTEVLQQALATVQAARREFLLAHDMEMVDEAGKTERRIASQQKPRSIARDAPEKGTTCARCGQPVALGSAFCGACGAKVEAEAPAKTVAPADRPGFCASCGAPLGPSAQFCGQCGHRVEAKPAAEVARPAPAERPAHTMAEPPPPAPPEESEPVLGVIPSVEGRKGALGYQSYNIVVTRRRLVFAVMTQQVMNDAIRRASDEARREGKGVLARISAQMGWMRGVVHRYESASVEETLREHSGNFSVPVDQINDISIEPRGEDEAEDVVAGLAERATKKWDLLIECASGSYQFELKAAEMPYVVSGGQSAEEAMSLLKQALAAAGG